MTQSLQFDDLRTLPFFQHTYAHKILPQLPQYTQLVDAQDADFLEFIRLPSLTRASPTLTRANKVKFAERPIPDLRSAITYLKDQENCEHIYISNGPSLYRHFYNEHPDIFPIDYLVLTVFDGQVALAQYSALTNRVLIALYTVPRRQLPFFPQIRGEHASLYSYTDSLLRNTSS